MSETLLEVEALTKHYASGGFWGGPRRLVRAVDGVSFTIASGETLALVGESGCGKTTTGLACLRLLKPTAGCVRFDGQDVLALRAAPLRALRREMQIIFQDPLSSLNPRMRIEHIVGEGLAIHGMAAGRERQERVRALLARVGLDGGDDVLRRLPHEFSGGQRQRIGIARALAVEPKLIVCDEPTSALDVSVQAQIVNLLAELQAELSLSYLFISHDLALVKRLAHRVAVMYLGRIVELASTKTLAAGARHPYTQALLAAVPNPDPAAKRERVALSGEPPSPMDPPSGCHFHPRCPHATDRCRIESPPLYDLGAGHGARCFLAEDDAGGRTVPDGAPVATGSVEADDAR